MSQKTVIAKTTLVTGQGGECVEHPPDSEVSLEACEADDLVARGLASLPTPVAPSTEGTDDEPDAARRARRRG